MLASCNTNPIRVFRRRVAHSMEAKPLQLNLQFREPPDKVRLASRVLFAATLCGLYGTHERILSILEGSPASAM